ncbi:MAG: undecaprenyl-diphosphatase UppP [Caldisericaceae bacterium]
MNFLEVVFLGVVQGATEFLPISSSGHLVLLPALLRIPIPNLAFTMGLHVGTLLAVLIYFWNDLKGILKGIFSFYKKDKSEEGKYYLNLFILIVVATIPAGIVGFLFADKVDLLFYSPRTVSYLFFITAAFLFLASYLAKKANKSIQNMTLKDAIIVGIFQVIALLPGVSRSGTTITGGIVSSVNKEESSRFSFLLSIPVIAGAALLELVKADFSIFTPTELLVGIVVSFISGLIALKIFFPIIKKTSFYTFAVYCVIIGLIGIIFTK